VNRQRPKKQNFADMHNSQNFKPLENYELPLAAASQLVQKAKLRGYA